MQLNIVSAESEIFSGDVKNLTASAEMGEVGIYPQHTPMISPLKPGEVKVLSENDEELNFYISGGMLEVQPHIVTILADTAMRGQDLDEAKALEAKKRAEEALTGIEIQIGTILHPSPASPAANRGWAAAATKQLIDQSVWNE